MKLTVHNYCDSAFEAWYKRGRRRVKDARPVDIARNPKNASDDELRYAIALFKKTVSPGGSGPRSQALAAMVEELKRRGVAT